MLIAAGPYSKLNDSVRWIGDRNSGMMEAALASATAKAKDHRHEPEQPT
jgi:phosphopantothenoylcysteine synthetase/decarboxylase